MACAGFSNGPKFSSLNAVGPEFGRATMVRIAANTVNDCERLTLIVSAYLSKDGGYPNANTTRAGFLVFWGCGLIFSRTMHALVG